jgi:hypothetical protein
METKVDVEAGLALAVDMKTPPPRGPGFSVPVGILCAMSESARINVVSSLICAAPP